MFSLSISKFALCGTHLLASFYLRNFSLGLTKFGFGDYHLKLGKWQYYLTVMGYPQ
jgi:hypothetical protein